MPREAMTHREALDYIEELEAVIDELKSIIRDERRQRASADECECECDRCGNFHLKEA